MPFDPDRRSVSNSKKRKKENAKKKAKKKPTREPELPKSKKIAQLGKFQPPKTAEPMIISEPKASVSDEKVQEPEQLLKSSEETSIYATQKPTQEDTQTTEEQAKAPDEAEISATKLSREKARGHTCVWHPWREAYAICEYCHRPFCYEDTAEFNKKYYCIEDMDNISSSYEKKLTATEHNLTTLAGILLIVSFFIFLYSAYNQVYSALNLVYSDGLFNINQIGNGYIFALAEGIIVLLGFIGAMLLFAQSRRGFYIAAFSCISALVVFSYQFIQTRMPYLAIIDAIAFISLIALIYSKAAGLTSDHRLRSETSISKSNVSKWPKAGEF